MGWRKGMRLTVDTAEPGLVSLTADDGRTIAFVGADVGDLTAMVTELRDLDGTIEVRAIGCEAPREDR